MWNGTSRTSVLELALSTDNIIAAFVYHLVCPPPVNYLLPTLLIPELTNNAGRNRMPYRAVESDNTDGDDWNDDSDSYLSALRNPSKRMLGRAALA